MAGHPEHPGWHGGGGHHPGHGSPYLHDLHLVVGGGKCRHLSGLVQPLGLGAVAGFYLGLVLVLGSGAASTNPVEPIETLEPIKVMKPRKPRKTTNKKQSYPFHLELNNKTQTYLIDPIET